MYGNPPQGQDLMHKEMESGYKVASKDLPAGPGFFDKQFVISKHSLWILAGLGALLWYNTKE